MNDKHNPFFSIIIPSYNREEEIRELLDSLEKQTLSTGQFEVIIVDDGSTDGTADFLDDYIAHSRTRIRYFKQANQGPGAARNHGMDNATGEVLVFIDSDCIATPGWLNEIKKAFDGDPSIQAFGGRDSASPDFKPLLKAIDYSMTSFISTGGMRGGKKKRLAKFYPRSFNMGLRTDLYHKIGGFGKLRHGQDIEFSNRIIRSGAKVVYLSDAVVYHKRRTSPGKFFRQLFNWGVARINLYKIDSAMLEPLHFAPAAGFWFVVLFSLLSLLFEPLRPVWLVLVSIFTLIMVGTIVDAFMRWKNLQVALLAPLMIVIQFTAYGLGFSFAYTWRVLLGRGEFTGFVKRYYR